MSRSALLGKLQKQHEGDAEILRLIETVRAEQSEQRKLREVEHARNLLADELYDQAITLLTQLQKEFVGRGKDCKASGARP